MENNNDPEEEELQERAREVMGQIKVLWISIAIAVLAIVSIVAFFAYTTFGLVGVIIISLMVLMGLYALSKYLEGMWKSLWQFNKNAEQGVSPNSYGAFPVSVYENYNL